MRKPRPATVKIPYAPVRAGRRYFQPTPQMKAAGFLPRALGPDNDTTRAEALRLYEDWLRYCRGEPPLPRGDTREDIEAARAYPAGSIGAAFQRLTRTRTWAAIPPSTRNKNHWPAWIRIRDAWGESDPNRMTMELLDEWQAELIEDHGRGVAHKTLKFWRWLWKRMAAMQVALIPDPSLALRNHAPAPRRAMFSEGEAVRLAKAAWRAGQRDLAVIVAATWDTMFQPGDVRTLQLKHVGRMADGRVVFDRTAEGEGRAKTGKAAIGTLSRRHRRSARRRSPPSWVFGAHWSAWQRRSQSRSAKTRIRTRRPHVSKIDDGGPAFPQSDLSTYGMGPDEINNGGMSLRDWFAGHAPAVGSDGLPRSHAEALMKSPAPDWSDKQASIAWWIEAQARYAYAHADAMLAARKAEGEAQS